MSEDENTFRGVGIGGLVVGGLAAVGLVTYAVLSSGSGETASREGKVVVAPFIGPGGGGAALGGSF